jgi:hypothetical protein
MDSDTNLFLEASSSELARKIANFQWDTSHRWSLPDTSSPFAIELLQIAGSAKISSSMEGIRQ